MYIHLLYLFCVIQKVFPCVNKILICAHRLISRDHTHSLKRELVWWFLIFYSHVATYRLRGIPDKII